MGYIKSKAFRTAGQLGFPPWYPTSAALMKVIADTAGPMPCVEGGVRALSIDFVWICDVAEWKNFLEQMDRSRSPHRARARARMLLELDARYEGVHVKR